jgi:hypothetical protein
MAKPKLLFFFSERFRNFIADKPRLKFFLFMEDNPKHRVAENISIILLSFFALFNYILGIVAFFILGYYGVFPFIAYFFGVMLTTLETLHWFFDR